MAKRQRIDIKSSDDLVCIMEDMFDEFAEKLFDDDRHSHPVDDDCRHWEEEGITRLYYKSSADLLRRYKERLKNLFKKHFPDEQFSITSTYFREF